jgi:hypothetical protein
VTVTAASATALRAVEAYGGVERWQAAQSVEATFSFGGLLARAKRGRANHRDMKVQARVATPYVRIEPFEAPDTVAILDGGDVRLERPDGTPVLHRRNARERFPYGPTLLRFDRADFAYFVGYAAWNYLTLPALLLREEIDWQPIGEHALRARFPSGLPTHYHPQQDFYFDPETGRLKEYHYLAEIFGGWAHAAQVVTEHAVNADGLAYAARRRVYPRQGPNRPGARPGPLMMSAETRDYRVR